MYSNPDMFFELWSQEIMKKMKEERKKRKLEAQKRREQREAAQKAREEAEAEALKKAQDIKVETTAVSSNNRYVNNKNRFVIIS